MSRSVKKHPNRGCPNGRRKCGVCVYHGERLKAKSRRIQFDTREQLKDIPANALNG